MITNSWVRLYGVITKILPNGEFIKCTPILVKEEPFGPAVYPPYYCYKRDSNNKIIGLQEIDISKYGHKLYLPANHKTINDGKEHFIVFQKSKDFPARGVPHTCCNNIISVGILFPKKFTHMFSVNEFSEEELLYNMQQN